MALDEKCQHFKSSLFLLKVPSVFGLKYFHFFSSFFSFLKLRDRKEEWQEKLYWVFLFLLVNLYLLFLSTKAFKIFFRIAAFFFYFKNANYKKGFLFFFNSQTLSTRKSTFFLTFDLKKKNQSTSVGFVFSSTTKVKKKYIYICGKVVGEGYVGAVYKKKQAKGKFSLFLFKSSITCEDWYK